MKATKTNDAMDAYKAHLRAISTLLLDTINRVDALRESAGDRAINWADVGSMTQAREHAVETAWKIGVITTEEAKAKHGVVL